MSYFQGTLCRLRGCSRIDLYDVCHSNVIQAIANSGLRVMLNAFFKVLLEVCRLLAITKLELIKNLHTKK